MWLKYLQYFKLTVVLQEQYLNLSIYVSTSNLCTNFVPRYEYLYAYQK